MSAMYLFYFHDVRGYSQAQSSILLLIYILIGVVGGGRRRPESRGASASTAR